MSFPREQDPVPELSTTRIGGGGRAWLIAIGALVVLGSVVYVGLGGQSASPGSSRAPAASTLVAAATAVPRPISTPDLSQVQSIRADPSAPVLYQYLGTGLTLNGHGTLAILDQVAEDQYRGIYRIPYSAGAPTAHLEFDAVTSSVSHDDLDRIGSWNFPVAQLSTGVCCPSVTVLDIAAAPQDMTMSDPDFARIATNGYRMTVTAQNEADAALMTIDVNVNPDQIVPDYPTTVPASQGPPTR